MTEPNPTIDLAKARAAMTKFRKLSQLDRPAAMGMWFVTYAEALLTALEQMQAENEKYRKALELIARHTRNVTGAPDMVRIALGALGNTPGDME